MDHVVTSLTAIATAIIGVAILSVLVSNNSNTSNVISSTGTAFANALGAAEAPITGGSNNNLLSSITDPLDLASSLGNFL